MIGTSDPPAPPGGEFGKPALAQPTTMLGRWRVAKGHLRHLLDVIDRSDQSFYCKGLVKLQKNVYETLYTDLEA